MAAGDVANSFGGAFLLSSLGEALVDIEPVIQTEGADVTYPRKYRVDPRSNHVLCIAIPAMDEDISSVKSTRDAMPVLHGLG